MKYSVKNVKSVRGHDGCPCYQATLYRDKKRVATVDEDTHGGPNKVHWFDFKEPRVQITVKDYKGDDFVRTCTPEEAQFLESFKGKTYEFMGKTSKHSEDTFVGELVEEFDKMKQYKKWCKKETVFRLKGDKKDSWRTICLPFCDPRAKTYLVDKYGSKVETILNEKIA